MLPVLLDNVLYYKIDDRYAFRGDLIITPRIIYFFPHTDLEQERINHGVDFLSGAPGGDLAREVFTKIMSGFGISQPSSHPGSGIASLWNKEDSSEELQSRLDAHIARLKKDRTVVFSSSLPVPGRLLSGYVIGLRLERDGVLSFHADSDRHDFDIGATRFELIARTLFEAGFTGDE